MNNKAQKPLELVGYHGTTRTSADSILLNKNTFQPSENRYDWLGSGIYFWLFSSGQARRWAEKQCEINNSSSPAILQAVIRPQNCLNLHEPSNQAEVLAALEFLEQFNRIISDEPLPKNNKGNSMLDCAVIRTLHALREKSGQPAYDCVLGIFEEGDALYPGSAIKQNSHVQIAVCNPRCIVSLSDFL